ncbi:MAG: hypothetical protein HYS32_04560 [Candidatus Woesearchaeota archaeon]|nr:MAG: hypothetical protein HYS32_04560 [Candidatus Woesearchaeota archaeon]
MIVLNKNQLREITNFLEKRFGFKGELNYTFLREGKELFVTNKDVSKMHFKGLKVRKTGVYFGKVLDGDVLLSVEGSQIVGKSAKNNVIVLAAEEVYLWLSGAEIKSKVEDGIYLVREDKDFLGCCKVRNNIIINSLSMDRRVKILV